MTNNNYGNNMTADQFDEMRVYEQPLKEHIKELRNKIIWCISFLVVSFFAIATFGGSDILQFLAAPIRNRGIQFIYVGLAEALIAQMKVSFVAAVVVTSPMIFWHIWDFVKPALYENEKRAALIFSFSSVMLFIIGILFGYIVVFLSSISFFVMMGEGIATPMLSISQYIGFLFSFTLAFGVVFEIPIVIYVLCKIGLVSVELLTGFRKYFILGIFVLSAFLTPPDVFSQCLMALPMMVLYEIGILVAKWTL